MWLVGHKREGASQGQVGAISRGGWIVTLCLIYVDRVCIIVATAVRFSRLGSSRSKTTFISFQFGFRVTGESLANQHPKLCVSRRIKVAEAYSIFSTGGSYSLRYCSTQRFVFTQKGTTDMRSAPTDWLGLRRLHTVEFCPYTLRAKQTRSAVPGDWIVSRNGIESLVWKCQKKE